MQQTDSITAEQFAQLARDYNRIPLTRTVLADLDTPLSAYMTLAQGSGSYLFESIQDGEQWGRYSFIGLPAQTILTVRGSQVAITVAGKEVETHVCRDPFDFIAAFQARFRVAPLTSEYKVPSEPKTPSESKTPVFCGGLVGYFAYDSVRYVETSLQSTTPEDTLNTPDIVLLVSDELLVFDNKAGTIQLHVYADPVQKDAFANACLRLDALEQRLQQVRAEVAPMALLLTGNMSAEDMLTEQDFVSSFGKEAYQAAVETIKDYIVAGDVMQVVPSQRLSVPFSAPPLNVYRALRYLNPSPYMYFLHIDDFYIVGSSPEILVRVEEGEVTVRPLAGTRRRGHTEEEDKALEQDLKADPKERAEHVMLIDLGRNDIGRIAQTGSVAVTETMNVERYAHVMHLSSTVKAQLAENLTALDVLRATLPAGTLSGAPKVRAMQIIDELEPVKRGIYGGAVGYLSWHGNMDMAIAIRTAVIKDGQLSIQAGAGIVADSDPQQEWEETMNKARAMFRAVSMAYLT